MQFSVKRNAKNWKWDKVVNTDFSGKFTLSPFQNKRFDNAWGEDSEAIPLSLIHAPKDKFEKGIISWSAIWSNGSIPAGTPVNFTKWLHQKQFRVKNLKKYLTGDVYSKLLTEEAAPAINKVLENTDLSPIFQDDQDNKHWTTLVKSTVAYLII